MDDPKSLLRAAEEVLGILQRHRVDAVVIGAAALAAHHYVRQTEDVDLGVNADVPALSAEGNRRTDRGRRHELNGHGVSLTHGSVLLCGRCR